MRTRLVCALQARVGLLQALEVADRALPGRVVGRFRTRLYTS